LRIAAAEVHNAAMFDWNDLKYLLAVARNNSTTAAGKVLGLSQSTVHRRLAELERKLQRKLVTRTASGYRLTEFGESLIPLAERVEAAIVDIERRATGDANEAIGVIRITCPEPIVLRLMQSGFVDRFHAQHPALRMEFVTSDRYLDLGKGEADIAFRSGDTDDDLVGRKIADSLWAVYASRGYVERHGRPASKDELSSHALVCFDDTMSKHRAATWLQEIAPHARIAARNNSVLGLVYAIKSGIGLGPLPTALGDAEPDLVRVFGPIPELSRAWRLLTHADLRHAPRIAAFFDFVASEKNALKSILTG
jgi:DNA-binding transcriptional LysR family regulator